VQVRAGRCGELRVLVGTVAIRSASKGPMRRFSLLGVVGLLVFSASGCFSGSAGAWLWVAGVMVIEDLYERRWKRRPDLR
jgi:hypothetical protein